MSSEHQLREITLSSGRFLVLFMEMLRGALSRQTLWLSEAQGWCVQKPGKKSWDRENLAWVPQSCPRYSPGLGTTSPLCPHAS